MLQNLAVKFGQFNCSALTPEGRLICAPSNASIKASGSSSVDCSCDPCTQEVLIPAPLKKPLHLRHPPNIHFIKRTRRLPLIHQSFGKRGLFVGAGALRHGAAPSCSRARPLPSRQRLAAVVVSSVRKLGLRERLGDAVPRVPCTPHKHTRARAHTYHTHARARAHNTHNTRAAPQHTAIRTPQRRCVLGTATWAGRLSRLTTVPPKTE